MGGGTFYEGIILALLSGLLELARPRLHFLEGGTLKLFVTKRLWLGLFLLILFSHSSGVLRPERFAVVTDQLYSKAMIARRVVKGLDLRTRLVVVLS